MILVAVVVALFAAFVASSEAAIQGAVSGRFTALAAGTLAIPLCVVGLFFSMLAEGFRCDDHCESRDVANVPPEFISHSARWQDYRDSWQWQGLLDFALLASAAVLVAVVLVAAKKYRPASLAMVVATLSAVAWAITAVP